MLLIIALIGAIGYLTLAPHSGPLQVLYMVVSTIFGVSNGEEIISTNHSPALRLFNILIIILGFVASAYVLASVTSFLVERDISNIFWRRKMQKRISELKHHYVVCGLGATGRHAIEELQKTGTPFVVVEIKEEVFTRLREHESGRYKELLCIVGDATDDDVLEEANIGHAKGLIAALGNDKDNLVVTVMVRQRNPHVRIVARCSDPRFAEKLTKAGANSTVSPNTIGGLRMASEVLRPHVVGFLDMMLKQQGQTLRVEEIEVGEQSPWAGKALGELNLREHYNILPMALKEPGHGAARGKEEFLVNPHDNHSLQKNSVIIVMGDLNDIKRAREHASHEGLHMMGAHHGKTQ
jgi:voltage-gated potassium channel